VMSTLIRPATDGLRFLHLPVPTVSSTTPCGASTRSGRRWAYHVPCPYQWMVQVPPLRRWRNGLRGGMGESPYRAMCLLAQACQHLWLVGSHDVYQRFTWVDQAIPPSPRPRRCSQSPSPLAVG
jgi:hypothetical protein